MIKFLFRQRQNLYRRENLLRSKILSFENKEFISLEDFQSLPDLVEEHRRRKHEIRQIGKIIQNYKHNS